LFDYALFPVCSPEFIARVGPDASLADLMQQPLVAIYTEVQNWDAWFTSAGVEFEPKVPYLMVDTLAVALEMALNGEGVALVNGPFVDQDLASGRLVKPSDHVAVCPGSWGLICRKDMKDNLRIRTFIDWMTSHVANPG
jgi:LysR family glycine cleavage system transcriptional activator